MFFRLQATRTEDVLRKVTEHTQTVHKMNKIPLDILDKARSASRDEGRARAHKAGKVERGKGIIRGGDVDSRRKKWVPPSTFHYRGRSRTIRGNS